ncbi:MAG: porin family protein, partial [Xanthobacteraceae bacterium]
MKNIALFGIAAAAVLAAAPAFAADLRPMSAPMYKAPPMMVPPASWTGFYIGADLGGSWSHTNGSWT